MMKRLLAIMALCALWAAPAIAQSAIKIPTCGTAQPPTGASQVYMDASGNLCVTTGGSSNITATQILTQTVSNAAYASGNSVGALLSFTTAARSGHSTGFVQKMILTMPDSQTPTLDVIFFNANPTASTITDRAAIVLDPADQNKVVGVAHISDCTGYSTPTVCQVQNVAMPFVLASGQTLFTAIVARSTFTPGNLPVGAPAWVASLTTLQD